MVGKLTPCPSDENKAAVNEHDRSANRRDKFRAWEGRRWVAKPVLNVCRPDDHGNRKSEAQPKLVAKHCHGVSSVAVVTSMGIRHLVTSMWIGRLSVILVRCVIHCRTPTSWLANCLLRI